MTTANCKVCYKDRAFESAIKALVADEKKLRTLSWSGIPNQHRALTWKLLLGYVPVDASQRSPALKRKRQEYIELAATYYSAINADQKALRQIRSDIPRTCPDVHVLRHPRARISLERLLYTLANENPAMSYVQGMDDLVAPLFVVFLSDALFEGDIDRLLSPNSFLDSVGDSCVLDTLASKTMMEQVEADCYWCLSRILTSVQENYIPEQPGLHRMVNRLDCFLRCTDPNLHEHLRSREIEVMHFAFRWMNCLLLREISIKHVIRMWDTYISVGVDAFEDFHVFVCAALLDHFSDELQSKQDFDGLFLLLQSLPTRSWGDKDVELLLRQAYVFCCLSKLRTPRWCEGFICINFWCGFSSTIAKLKPLIGAHDMPNMMYDSDIFLCL